MNDLLQYLNTEVTSGEADTLTIGSLICLHLTEVSNIVLSRVILFKVMPTIRASVVSKYVNFPSIHIMYM